MYWEYPCALHDGYGTEQQFACRQLTVRSGKGDKDRSAVLPDALTAPLQQHRVTVRVVGVANAVQGPLNR